MRGEGTGWAVGQDPTHKPLLAMFSIWIVADENRRKILKSLKWKGGSFGFGLQKGHPDCQGDSGAEEGEA